MKEFMADVLALVCLIVMVTGLYFALALDLFKVAMASAECEIGLSLAACDWLEEVE